jgi:hypothetical protein
MREYGHLGGKPNLDQTLNDLESRLKPIEKAAAELSRLPDRVGSVCLNRFWVFAKWISALVMPLLGLASAR